MKIFVLALLIMSSSSAFAFPKCDKVDLARTKNLLDEAHKRIDVGTMAPMDLPRAELNYLDAQFCSGTYKQRPSQICAQGDYCDQKLALLIKIESNLSIRFNAGMASIDQLIEAQTRIREFKSTWGIVETNK